MANSNRSTTLSRRITAKPSRASEKAGIRLDVKAAALRDLMTEQSRQLWGWSTFYSGTRAELVRAGIPDHLFTRGKRRLMFRANDQDAYIQFKRGGYELELQWDPNGPWYKSAAHPALSELARMVLCGISWWMEGDESADGWKRNDEVAVQKLIDCEAAVDYRLPPSKRFKFAPGYKDQISNLSMKLHHLIQNAEIMPIEMPEASKAVPSDGKVIDMKQATAALDQRRELAKGERPL
jgi:hypothetical protein